VTTAGPTSEAAQHDSGRELPDARWRGAGPIALRVALLAAAGWALHREVAGLSSADLLRHLGSYGWRHLALAGGCTAASFLVLGLLELLALRYGDIRNVPPAAGLMTGFLANAFSQSVGLALLTGAAVRLRVYRRYAIQAVDIARISAFVTLSVSLGLLATGAGALLASSTPAHLGRASVAVRPAGALLGMVVLAYVAWSIVGRRETLGRGSWMVRRPGPLLAAAQVCFSALDWLLTGTVLFAFVPPSVGVDYPTLLRVYLTAQTVAVVSHVPGGVGVLELVVLTMLADVNPADHAAIVASLLMFRVIYYLVPLIAAGLVAIVAELVPDRSRTIPQRAGHLGAPNAPHAKGRRVR
jgi:uncharacterized membrane protein YbhN (UPF0104 family)